MDPLYAPRPLSKEELYARPCPGFGISVGEVRILPGLRQLAGNDYEARRLLTHAQSMPPASGALANEPGVRDVDCDGNAVRMFKVRGHDGVHVWFAGLPTSEPPKASDITGAWVRGATRYILVQRGEGVWKARVSEDGQVTLIPACIERGDVLRLARSALPGAPVIDYLRCVHCGEENYEDFMVEAWVWRDAGLLSNSGRVHLACLAERLERPLVVGDFSRARINDALLFGYRMGRASVQAEPPVP